MSPTRCVPALVLGLALLAGCSPIVATNGNMVSEQHLAEISVGSSTKDDVVAALGSPTTVATFDPNTWYYIGQRTEQEAFFAPEVVDRRIVEVTFDPDSGTVRDVRRLGLEDGREVALVDRETPTMGRRLTVLEQIIGNLGRYTNTDSGSGSVMTPGQPGGGVPRGY